MTSVGTSIVLVDITSVQFPQKSQKQYQSVIPRKERRIAQMMNWFLNTELSCLNYRHSVHEHGMRIAVFWDVVPVGLMGTEVSEELLC
jgi:hypothetical protein